MTSPDEVLADLAAGLSPRDPYDDMQTLAAEIRRLLAENEQLRAEVARLTVQHEDAADALVTANRVLNENAALRLAAAAGSVRSSRTGDQK